MRFNSFLGRSSRLAVLAVAVLGTAACADKLLDVTDPDIINPGDIENALGADAVRIGALGRFNTATMSSDVNNGEGIFLLGGLLADEWRSSNTFTQTDEIDMRAMRNDNANVEGNYRRLNVARVAAIQAIDLLKRYPPLSGTIDATLYNARQAQMYMVRGLSELYLAESYCNGLIFSDASGAEIKYGAPMTTAQAAERALASFDTAASLAAGADTLSVRMLRASRVARARALVWLDRFPEAVTVLGGTAGVPTTFEWRTSFSQSSGFDHGIWAINNNQKRYNVGDSVDTAPQAARQQNSIPFVSAADPRVPTQANGSSFQTNIPNFMQRLWPARDGTIQILSGVDARLIEAEADLKAGGVNWIVILNSLRQGPITVGENTTIQNLTPLVLPATQAERVSLFFREKAFWQFGRGYRLGDLRRQVRQYQRDQATVFPNGPYFEGGNYGTDVNFPIPQAEQNNVANYQGCTNRDA